MAASGQHLLPLRVSWFRFIKRHTQTVCVGLEPEPPKHNIHMHKILRWHDRRQRCQEHGSAIVDGEGGVDGLIMTSAHVLSHNVTTKCHRKRQKSYFIQWIYPERLISPIKLLIKIPIKISSLARGRLHFSVQVLLYMWRNDRFPVDLSYIWLSSAGTTLHRVKSALRWEQTGELSSWWTLFLVLTRSFICLENSS